MLRSPELMNADDTALLVVDVQERLAPAIRDSETIIWNIRRLLDGAQTLGVDVWGTEQYPEKLGPTVPELAARLPERPSKVTFSARECAVLFSSLREAERPRVLVTGIETHVCVQQTALDLIASGFRVYVAADAVGSRFALDHETALRRMESSGVTVTTAEAVLFEWCERAGTPEFKAISSLAKSRPS